MSNKLHNNRFSVAPVQSNIQRSQFQITKNVKTTMNYGKLVPFYWRECLPGDTFQVSTSCVARMSTPLYPVMDNSFIDMYYFFVPHRLVWDHFAEFLGENKLSAWVSDIDYIIPHAEVQSNPGSLLDHLEVPTYSEYDSEAEEVETTSPTLDIGFLLPRSFWLIWNEWFRDENTMDPILINTGDDVTEQEIALCNSLPNVCKLHDAFTSLLPAPQKGDAVDIPLADWLPVITRDVYGGNTYLNGPVIYSVGDVSSDVLESGAILEVGGTPTVSVMTLNRLTNDGVEVGKFNGPKNLYASTEGSAVSINALRQAFQMQRLLELQARSGSRLTEIIRASFSVIAPDARLQRPEYLGGCRVNVQMQQIAQQSVTTDESPLGRLAAYSKTVSANRDFSYSVLEHGFIIGVMCARAQHTYSQGLHPMWSRRGRFDLYWPTFDHIGEQPVRVRQIFAEGTAQDNEIVGYQEAWWDYRTDLNAITGAFRPTVNANLDEWHYGDYFFSRPYLSQGFIEERSDLVDRTLAVKSRDHDQLILDINIHQLATRPMSVYSVPGLIDHF